ncbi:hypothetical protein [Curtobacterium sp. MCJR17_043]|uniref:hypothetical protein n=1 Tax=Curtobacterium sp. MCJR17_043 TaxID=2175660 RepID=UPI0024E02C5E|nr:hypothetical protein [Curtobacterium sp. MCJR17_043]WIB34806.1 hypothetical protein DEJ15_09510 [Curtobacterium sp. MCJR17_043]
MDSPQAHDRVVVAGLVVVLLERHVDGGMLTARELVPGLVGLVLALRGGPGAEELHPHGVVGERAPRLVLPEGGLEREGVADVRRDLELLVVVGGDDEGRVGHGQAPWMLSRVCWT